MSKGLGKGYKDLNKEEKEAIVEDYYKGIMVKDLIKIHNTTRRAVPAVLKEYNINTRRKNHYTLNEDYFETIDTEHKAYWLGFIAADGCITDTNYFAISLKDRDILLELKKDLEYTGEIYYPEYNNNENIYSRINFSSKKICNDLRKHGIHENKSFTYNNLPNISDDLMPHFIRGYFDGDGSVYVSKSRKNINKGSDKVYNTYNFNIIATKEFCENLNAYLSPILLYNSKIPKHVGSNMYYYKISNKDILIKIYNYLYKDSTIYLNRKYNIWREILGSITE